MYWTFSTMSVWEKVRRLINAQKFYATLPSKLDRAEQEFLITQANEGIPLPEILEHEPDGSDAQILLGGELHSRHTFMEEHE